MTGATLGELFALGPVSGFILVVTCAVSWYALAKNPNLYYDWMLNPYAVLSEKKYYQLITHGLIHGSWIHLFINMYVFYTFAFYLEGYLLGSLNFAIVYFGSMVISAVVSVWRRRNYLDFRSLGASGAISGILFSFILFNPNAELLLFFIIPMPAWLAAILFIAGSYYLSKNDMLPGIDHEGHLWGAISGAVLTLVLIPEAMAIFFHKLLG
jgi:membrane associated rhomboid family serine protease